MFKYKSDSSGKDSAPGIKEVPEKENIETKKAESKITPKKDVSKELPKDTSPAGIYEMLEKNLKWSQIIYEQNRKINSKMFWYAFAGWLRVFIILVPLAVAAWFLPPLVRQMWGQYESLVGSITGVEGTLKDVKNTAPSSVDQILKFLPMNQEQQEQLKTILK